MSSKENITVWEAEKILNCEECIHHAYAGSAFRRRFKTPCYNFGVNGNGDVVKMAERVEKGSVTECTAKME
jgi:hypothetical protein